MKKEKIFIESLMENLPDEQKELFETLGFKEEMMDALKKDMLNLPDNIDDNMLERFGAIMATMIAPNDNIDESIAKELEKIDNTDNFIIKVNELKNDYSLNELLSLCSLEQLKLYNIVQNLSFNDIKKDKIEDKDKLISKIKKDIISNFKVYLPMCRGYDIQVFESLSNDLNNFDKIDDSFIITGYIFQIKKGKKIHYIMPKELKDFIKKVDFSKTNKDTINYCTNLIKGLILMKGIVSKDEVYQFLIDLEDFNIKEKDIDKIIADNFKQEDDFFYIDGTVDKKTFNELVKVKDTNLYIVNSDDLIDYQMMIEYFFDIISFLSKKEFKEENYYNKFFYKPQDSKKLVKFIKKEFNIKSDEIEMVEEFLYNNMFDFHYWIYNGDTNDEDIINEILENELDDPFA